ncbi:MAG: ABC transporter permease [Gammaproteobacteria bacterium]
MWRSYFQVFLRNLVQQKTIAAINVLGLALGLCAFLVIGVYVRDEYSYESRWQHADRIARLINVLTLSSGEKISQVFTTELAAPRIKNFFPEEIERAARYLPVEAGAVSANGQLVAMDRYQADPDLIEIFDFEVLEGSLQQALAGPNRIALSEEEARRLFGDGPALGELLTWEQDPASFEVVAIYRAPPGKGSLKFTNISLWSETGAEIAARQNWFGSAEGYFLLRADVDPAALATSLDAFVNQQVQSPLFVPESSTTADVFTYRLQNIRDMHFKPNTDEPGGAQSTVNAFGAIALLVLCIGWSNFIILALARSVERQREVGIRKVAGATGPSLLIQFVGEAMLLALVAIVVALVLLEATLPVFAALMQTTLSIDLRDGRTLLALAALTLVTGGIGGVYPALALARQKPEVVLKPGDHSARIGTGMLRKALVSLQFLIATSLIIAALVLHLQLSFVRQRDPGFETANVVTLELREVERPSEVAVLRNAVAAIPGIERIALSSDGPVTTRTLLSRNLQQPGDESSRIETRTFLVDYDFFEIYGMELLAGRTYDSAVESASQAALATRPRPRVQSENARIVLNEASVGALGFASPGEAIGAIVEGSIGTPDGLAYVPVEIIGVVADNQFASLRLVPGNEAYVLNSFAGYFLNIKLDAAANTANVVADLQNAWREIRPLQPAVIEFADNSVRQAFMLEYNTGRLLSGFALLAILVASMGLYGLVSFETRRRKKEISIRSVLGGDLRNILGLFLARFAGPVFWTNALAWPLALWFMLRWLEQFPYRIDNWWLLPICLAAGALVIGIVATTVCATVVKVVEARPVDALRYE